MNILQTEKYLLTPAQLATYAHTTKRTVLFYDELGILKPAKILPNRYRLYDPKQIVELQLITLLRNLHLSTNEIKAYLLKKGTLKELFFEKKKQLQTELRSLELVLSSIDKFYKDAKGSEFLIKPEIKEVRGFKAYCIERESSYSKVSLHFLELRKLLGKYPKNSSFVIFYSSQVFSPLKEKMKFGIVTKDYEPSHKDLQMLKIPSYKALSYSYNGSPKFLSLLWVQLAKIAEDQNYKRDLRFTTGLEFEYSFEDGQGSFELQIPIK